MRRRGGVRAVRARSIRRGTVPHVYLFVRRELEKEREPHKTLQEVGEVEVHLPNLGVLCFLG